MIPEAAKTSWATRCSYAASDTAGQLVFCVVSFYLLKFYTDVYGLSAAAAGWILLLARLVDAVDAPVWGIIFDKTRSRWGKSRPWFLWLCGPFAVFGVLTFCTPSLSHTGKIIYAASTYVICSVLYTGINTPVTSILSALTSDPRERVTLTCFRMFGSKLGVLLVNLTALKWVAVLGHGNDRRGFMLVMPVYALGSVALYLLAFSRLKEMPSVVNAESSRLPVVAAFRAIRGNWPWLIIFSSSLFFWIAFIARVSVGPYLFQYVLHRQDLIPLANSLDFISLGTAFALPVLCRWTSKRNVWMAGLMGMVVGQLVMAVGLAGSGNLSWVMAGWALGFLASGMAMAMPFSVLSDSVDYAEWKHGIRAAGFLTAIGAAFCLKAGSGIGGALSAWIMQATGYVANSVQTNSAITGIELSGVWMPAAGFLLAAVPVFFYWRFEKLEGRIQADLALQRADRASNA